IRDLHVTGVQTCALPILTATYAQRGPGDHVEAPREMDERGRRTEIEPHGTGHGILVHVRGSGLQRPGIVVDLPSEELPAPAAVRSEERRVGKEGRASECQ